MKFSPGDLVVCRHIRDLNGHSIKVGETYVVASHGNFVHLEGYDGGFMAHRFEKLTNEMSSTDEYEEIISIQELMK